MKNVYKHDTNMPYDISYVIFGILDIYSIKNIPLKIYSIKILKIYSPFV